ncbi:50S ribosomal protein L10 [Patescibacteria group bacterium]|nr:50S ribosomal protein L10 [Patescibacteria group bacterium]
MAKTKQQKEQIVNELGEKIKGAKSAVFANYSGLNVADMEDLRNKCREQGVELTAVKKTLLRLALAQQDLKSPELESMEGSIGVATSPSDEVAAAKLIKEFAKLHSDVTFQGGLLEGELISREMVVSLSNIPSKLELFSKMVGSMQAPISGFVNVLQGNLRGLVCVLNAIKDNK